MGTLNYWPADVAVSPYQSWNNNSADYWIIQQSLKFPPRWSQLYAWLRILTVKTEELEEKKKLLLNKFLDVG